MLPSVPDLAAWRALRRDPAGQRQAFEAIASRHGLSASELTPLDKGTHLVWATGRSVLKLFVPLWNEDAILERSGALVVTRGERGCSIIERHTTTEVPAVPPHKIVDPTGVGDAFRGGLLKGLARSASYRVCAQLGSVAATYALEHLGGQSHAYTWLEFLERYEQHFGHASGL